MANYLFIIIDQSNFLYLPTKKFINLILHNEVMIISEIQRK